jgi:hypothetical protein
VKDLAEYARETVEFALAYELPDAPDIVINARAEGLIAITKEAGIALEQLLRWIHFRCNGKEWSLEEYRGWCAMFRRMNEEKKP